MVKTEPKSVLNLKLTLGRNGVLKTFPAFDKLSV
jgi:hypothetical protein